jgi:hypothetical protein
MTPEGKVKACIKKVLEKYKSDVDGFWPVPSGYGESHLDYVGCCAGFFFSIEVKAPGKKPTPRQKERIRTVTNARGVALVIDGTDKTTTYEQLDALLRALVQKAMHND